jgi:hypothetical protein
MIQANYLELNAEEKETIRRINKGFFSVSWYSEFGEEIDEFNRLEDATLYADLVDGEIVRGLI